MSVLGGLPVIPGATCQPAAAALGAAGLGPVCQAAGISSVAGSAASQVAGFGVDSVLNAMGSWVSDGATWLLTQIGTVIGDTTAIDLGASWFTAHYEAMAALSGVAIVPILLLGIMQSIYRQNASMLIRSVAVNVPLAILLTAVAVKLVQLGLAVTDAMSDAVAQGSGLDAGHFLDSVTLGLSGATAAGQPAPAFVLFVGGLAVVLGALMVWVELLIRAAAVYVAVLFLPLALASLAWPAIAHWCRRLVDTLVALVLGKFVIVSVLSLAAGALAGGTGSTPSGGGAAATGSGGGGGFSAVLGGAALLLFAALAPWALFRLLPFLEAGAVAQLESLSHRGRHGAAAPVKGLAQTAMRASAAGSALGSAAGLAAGSGISGSGLLGSSLAGSGTGGGGPGRAGRGSGPRGRSGPGGSGPPGSRPDPEPSSAQSTGVGTLDSPGHGIPAWGIHPEATAAARRSFDSIPTLPPVPGTGVTTGSSLRPLPRQTGALRPDTLGRDELGVRLIAAPPLLSAASDPGPRPAGDSRDL